MRKGFSFCILAIFLMLFSCHNDNEILNKMNKIKELGNSNPELALSMLDSLKYNVKKSDEHTLMLYDLLFIRLNDKAYHVATSDIMSNRVTQYFEAHGNDIEKQEAYYIMVVYIEI